jgi:hypothetical protein
VVVRAGHAPTDVVAEHAGRRKRRGGLWQYAPRDDRGLLHSSGIATPEPADQKSVVVYIHVFSAGPSQRPTMSLEGRGALDKLFRPPIRPHYEAKPRLTIVVVPPQCRNRCRQPMQRRSLLGGFERWSALPFVASGRLPDSVRNPPPRNTTGRPSNADRRLRKQPTPHPLPRRCSSKRPRSNLHQGSS